MRRLISPFSRKQVSERFFWTPTHDDSAWRKPLASASASYASQTDIAGVTAGLNVTYSNWFSLSPVIVQAKSSDPVVPVFYNSNNWSNLADDTWEPHSNSGAIETAIRGGWSPNFPADRPQFASVTADGGGTQFTAPSRYNPRYNWGRPLLIHCPAGIQPENSPDALVCIVQPDGTVFESLSTIILSSGEIASFYCHITDPSLGGTGWAGGARASMIPVYAGVIRAHEIEAARTANAMGAGAAKTAALQSAIPHAIAMYIPPGVLANSAVFPASTVDRGALSESPAYSGSNSMGTRWALPAAFDPTTLDLYGDISLAVAYTMKNYGCIAVDRSGGGIILAVEQAGSFAYDYDFQYSLEGYDGGGTSIFENLQKVTAASGFYAD